MVLVEYNDKKVYFGELLFGNDFIFVRLLFGKLDILIIWIKIKDISFIFNL